jgi:hypothetical protein
MQTLTVIISDLPLNCVARQRNAVCLPRLALAAVRQLRWHTDPVMRESVPVRLRALQQKNISES